MEEIMVGRYSEPSPQFLSCGGMNFNDLLLLSHVYVSVFPGMN
jgi:hypothetical protein